MGIRFHFSPPLACLALPAGILVPLMAKSGQYMPQRSQPLHFSGCTTCGGWEAFELNAEESASTCVGQNSTQKPQALQRSTTIETRPFATRSPSSEPRWLRCFNCGGFDYPGDHKESRVMTITDHREVEHVGLIRLDHRKL